MVWRSMLFTLAHRQTAALGCGGGRTDWTRGSHGAGPGAYEPANGVIDEMRRRVSSRTGAFGTSQTRFQVSKERKRDVPDVHGRTIVEIPGNRKRGPSRSDCGSGANLDR